MARQSYLPYSDSDKAVWLANFVEKLKLYDVVLGISPTTISTLEDERDVFVGAIVVVEAVRNSAEALTAFKNRLRESTEPLGPQPVLPTIPPVPPTVQGNIFGRIRELVNQIKSNPNYTESIGDDLRIIGDEISEDPSTWKPILGLGYEAGAPVIKWTKGQSKGLKIWVDRGAGFQLLAIDIRPNFTDNHDLPPAGQSALWKYRAIYVLNDAEVGQFSDILEVTVKGGV